MGLTCFEFSLTWPWGAALEEKWKQILSVTDQRLRAYILKSDLSWLYVLLKVRSASQSLCYYVSLREELTNKPATLTMAIKKIRHSLICVSTTACRHQLPVPANAIPCPKPIYGFPWTTGNDPTPPIVKTSTQLQCSQVGRYGRTPTLRRVYL